MRKKGGSLKNETKSTLSSYYFKNNNFQSLKNQLWYKKFLLLFFNPWFDIRERKS
jgi:hypothetical protein